MDITRIEIPIPNKGRIFLVDKDWEDSFEGDQIAIDYLYGAFEKAEKEGLSYSWMDHATQVTEKITTALIFNCDAIKAVLKHNGIDVPDDFPTDSSRFTELNELKGLRVIF